MSARTDLAIDEQQHFSEDTEGIECQKRTEKGICITTVQVKTPSAEKRIGKPRGTYVTLEIDPLRQKKPQAFTDSVQILSKQINTLLREKDEILVVCLGNEAVTPDAVGPLTMRNLIVTRHLKRLMRGMLPDFAAVSAVEPGVLGTTGIESAEAVRAIAQKINPKQLIVIDALATNEPSRICATVQLTDTGITPGSGVGNRREAFDYEHFGIPVLAIGVPTVVDAAPLFPEQEGMIVIPRDIDASVREIARLIGYALNLTLHKDLRPEDIACFLP